jgi:hypothetical protein
MPVPSHVPAGSIPPAWRTWGNQVVDTLEDHAATHATKTELSEAVIGEWAPDLTTVAADPAFTGTYLTLDDAANQYAVPEAAGGLAQYPLDIPTFDGTPSTTHLDVLFIPEGWNGYRYWMVHTPYPTATRENPEIVASHDGVTWVEPAGISNPVVPYAEIQGLGHGHNSDGILVMLADGVTMACYYRGNAGAGGEKIYRKTSTDGVTWSAAVATNLATANADKYLSPSVLLNDDSTYTMWHVNYGAADPLDRLERCTSTDGITWSASSTCTFPEPVRITGAETANTPRLWHLDVEQAGGKYHMLANVIPVGITTRLYYFTSTDGVTWTRPGPNHPAVPLTTDTAFDADGGHYRSAFQPVPGTNPRAPVQWQVWVAGRRSGAGDPTGKPWRCGFYDGVELPMDVPSDQRGPFIRVPRSANFGVPAAATWPGANYYLIQRFTVPERETYRYCLLRIAVASGNIQVAVVKFNSTTAWVRRMDSGIIACPTAGNAVIDLGAETLEPGEYGLCFWADNTTLQVHRGSASGVNQGTRAVGDSTAAGGVPTQAQAMAYTDFYLAGIALLGQ